MLYFFYLADNHKSENKVVLVFSNLGISRSATVVIAYLMKSQNWSLKVYTRSYEPSRIEPNFVVYELQSYRPVCTFVQSDQHLCYSLSVKLPDATPKMAGAFFLFDLILCVPSTIFQLNRDGSFWAEPVLS